MNNAFELDVREVQETAQDLVAAATTSEEDSWPFSCESTRNSRCCD